MSLELCILASGSSGNASVVRSRSGAMLIDLGIGPRTLAKRLDGTGVRLADIRAVCLTHLDSDHFNPNWIGTLITHQIRVHCHEERVGQILRCAPEPEAFKPLIRPFVSQSFEALDGVCLTPLPLAHDQAGSHGFLVEHIGHRLGFATDLGTVPHRLIQAFEGVDLLAIESNYCPVMQQASPRPEFLKRRITGGRGHLSNQQAMAAIRQILDRAQARRMKMPDHIVLLHRSRQCNCPNVVRSLFNKDARIARRLVLAEQHLRTEWLRPRHVAPATGEQLLLSWG